MILAVLDARAGLGIGGARCLSQRRGRPEDRRAGGRSGGGRRADFVFRWRSPCRGTACSSARISLSGDIRPVPQAELRLKEAAKLGFTPRLCRRRAPRRRCRAEAVPESNQCDDLLACARCTQCAPKAAHGRGRIKNHERVRFHLRRHPGGRGDRLGLGRLCDLARLRARNPDIFAWAAAAFATLYFGPSLAALIAAPHVASLAGERCWLMLAVFLVVLIPLSFMSYRFSQTRAAFPDRARWTARWALPSAWCAGWW